MTSVKDLRMRLTEENVKNILAKHGVYVHTETEAALIFPTVCHNLDGGSPKLYYYKDEKIFRCYTECANMFDIFELLIKMKKLRGEEIGLRAAIALTGLEQGESTISQEVISDLQYLQRLREGSQRKEDEDVNEVKILDKAIIDRYMYNEVGLRSWIEEGIGVDALRRFSIKYDSTINAIIIPNLNHEGQLIGMRGRFLGENVKAKYMPIRHNGVILSHPTGKYFYGYYENKHEIRKKGVAVIFEGEKSVLKMETYFPGNNVALSTAGQRITLDHLNALLRLGIREVVLAYDKDYLTVNERTAKLEDYRKITKVLSPYFEVSIIIDYGEGLKYQDSPVDAGKDVFNELMKNRIKR